MSQTDLNLKRGIFEKGEKNAKTKFEYLYRESMLGNYVRYVALNFSKLCLPFAACLMP